MLSPEVLTKFIKFVIVGFSGLVIDFGLTWLFKEKFKTQKYLANSIGFMGAASSNYIFNRIWTFESTDPAILQQYLSFLIISLIGLLLNNLMVFVAHEKFRMNFYLAKIFAIGAVTFWNFGANYFYTFR